MNIKRSTADKYFSMCVREAADYTCQRCNKAYDRSKAQGLHNSHVFSRRHRVTRWEPDNGVALCYSCHQWYGGDPVESAPWVEDHLGLGVLEILTEKKGAVFKIPKSEEKLIAAHYKAEYIKLLERRENRETGKLNFLSYF